MYVAVAGKSRRQRALWGTVIERPSNRLQKSKAQQRDRCQGSSSRFLIRDEHTGQRMAEGQDPVITFERQQWTGQDKKGHCVTFFMCSTASAWILGRDPYSFT